MKVAVVLATVQREVVVDANVTGRPELAVAVSVRGVPRVWAAMGLKVMVWVVRGVELTVFKGAVHPAKNAAATPIRHLEHSRMTAPLSFLLPIQSIPNAPDSHYSRSPDVPAG
jgi:hypothetical protein